ncbi:MAG: nucleotidyltransferase domain-containing protein [Candidatus Saganbacteria bacterium]|nr:nucleotidyltransferase domain-containing protein [Candidatus Saganbacteria bacterium]
MISFKSKITIKILDYYFLNPDSRHYINELAKLLELDPKNLDRKLKELEKEGLLKSEFQGKERYFYLNKTFPLLNHYRQIFLKTCGIEHKLREMVKNSEGVKEAYVFGSYAKQKMDASSDIDLLVVGEHSALELQRSISRLQKEIGREINLINMGPEELRKRKKKKDSLVTNIFKSKPIKLL